MSLRWHEIIKENNSLRMYTHCIEKQIPIHTTLITVIPFTMHLYTGYIYLVVHNKVTVNFFVS